MVPDPFFSPYNWLKGKGGISSHCARQKSTCEMGHGGPAHVIGGEYAHFSKINYFSSGPGVWGLLAYNIVTYFCNCSPLRPRSVLGILRCLIECPVPHLCQPWEKCASRCQHICSSPLGGSDQWRGAFELIELGFNIL